MQKYAKDYPSGQISRSCANFEEAYFLSKEDKKLVIEVASGFYEKRIQKKKATADNSDSSSSSDSNNNAPAIAVQCRNDHREGLLEFMRCAWNTLPQFQKLFGNFRKEYYCSNLDLAGVISYFTDAIMTFLFADKPNIIFTDGTSIVFPNKDGK